MKDKMTSGEIAREAGVSQKTLRVYDEKGLLKPVGYSEGNYKLYDKNSLMILEKIIALKHVGFSLEEIKSNLESGDDESIAETLKKQLELMENKIYEMKKAAECIKVALARIDENPDWDDVADVIKKMEMSQGQDERRWYAETHAADGIEWYEKIFDSMEFEKSDTVLDLGISYGLLYRKNWDRMPANLTVDGYDIHESWADNLDEDLRENREPVPDDMKIQVHFSNLEDEETWKEIRKKKYSKVMAHYFMAYMSDMEAIMKNVADVLTDGGFFSVTYLGVGSENDFWEKLIDEMGLDKSFALKKRKSIYDRQSVFEGQLSKYFSKVVPVVLPGPLRFDDSEELFNRMLKRFDQAAKYLNDHKEKIIEFFDKRIERDGHIILECNSTFYHCYK
ncbi:MerR family transcriptional regulator [Butyrivibrio sp. VCD2006]|uniref:MerR family transcriptional regulator n=1 Tax=Butyrivibrio sp. VCD2006 TaxID=1280664 RepID=UPI00042A0A76|nr:MerR family transcriptional regulator [Butyrivibrio sp. VCD2006]